MKVFIFFLLQTTLGEFCNQSNYEKFIWNKEKTLELIEKTGKGCQLHGADLTKMNPVATGNIAPTPHKTNLKKAFLQKANLYGANLSGVNLEKADLTEANLQRANLKKANLTEGNYQKAYLQGADLTRATLYKADLEQATLYKTDLKKANLTKANLVRARYDTETTLPSLFFPEKRGMIRNDQP